jgi:hypothetical protein
MRCGNETLFSAVAVLNLPACQSWTATGTSVKSKSTYNTVVSNCIRRTDKTIFFVNFSTASLDRVILATPIYEPRASRNAQLGGSKSDHAHYTGAMIIIIIMVINHYLGLSCTGCCPYAEHSSSLMLSFLFST